MTFRPSPMPTLLILLSSVVLPVGGLDAQSLTTRELNARAQAQASAATANLPPPPADRNTPFPVSTDPVEALSRYLRILATSPRDLNALTGAGNAALAIGDANAAVSLFARAEEVSPRNGRIKAGLAAGLVQLDQPLTAIRLFDEAVSLGVPEPEIAGDRGLAYDLRGETRRAQVDYAQALRWRSDDEVTRRLAVSQAIGGDKALALATLDGLLRRQDRAAWRIRAFVLALTGDRTGAEAAAIAVMPRGQAQALIPFFGRLAVLRPGQKAAAVHLGQFPSDGRSSTASQPMFADATPPPLPPRAAGGPTFDAPLVPAGNAPGARSDGASRPRQLDRLGVATPSPSTRATTVTTATVPSGIGRSYPVAGSSPTASSLPPTAPPSVASSPATDTIPPTLSTPSRSAVATGAAVIIAPDAGQVNPAANAAAVPRSAAPPRTAAAFVPQLATGGRPERNVPANRGTSLLTQAAGTFPDTAPAVARPLSSAGQGGNAAADAGAAAGFVSEPLATGVDSGATRLALNATPSQSQAAAVVRSFDPPPSTTASPAKTLASTRPAPSAEPARPSRRIAARLPEATPETAPAGRRTTRDIAAARAADRAETKAEKTGAKVEAPGKGRGAEAATDSKRSATTGKDSRTRKNGKDAKAATDAKDSKAGNGKSARETKDESASNRGAKADRKSEIKAEDKASAASGGEKYWVQVASGTNRDDLGKAWGETKAKAPKLLGGRTTWTTPWKQSNRLLVGPFKSEEEAQGMVNSLGKAGLGGIPYTTRGKAKVEKLGE